MARYQNPYGNTAPRTTSKNAPTGEPPRHATSSMSPVDDDDDIEAMLTAGGNQYAGQGQQDYSGVSPEAYAGYQDAQGQMDAAGQNLQDAAQQFGDGTTVGGGGAGGAVGTPSPIPEAADPRAPGGQTGGIADIIGLDPSATPTTPGGGQAGSYTEDPYDATMSEVQAILEAGQQDTSADEARIMDMYAGKSGAGMADLAAQFGAGGMGQSGALLGAGADLQGQLARQAGQDIMGVKNEARDRYMNELFRALGMGQSERQLGMQEEAYGNQAAFLEQLLQGDTSGLQDEDGDGFDDQYGIPMDQTQPGWLEAALGAVAGTVGGAGEVLGGGQPKHLSSSSELPPDAEFSHRAGGGLNSFVTPDGQIYYVPVGQ